MKAGFREMHCPGDDYCRSSIYIGEGHVANQGLEVNPEGDPGQPRAKYMAILSPSHWQPNPSRGDNQTTRGCLSGRGR